MRHVENLGRRPVVRLDEMVHTFFASDLDHARVAQLADVVVDRLRRQVQFARDLTHGHLLCSQEIDDPSSGLVSEELKGIWICDELEGLRMVSRQCMFVDVYNRFYDENDCFINNGSHQPNMQYNKGNGRSAERPAASDTRASREHAR